MKKIVSLFQRNYDGDRLVRDEVVPGAEWVLAGEGVATRKFDGTCCMVRDGKLYKRFDAKQGKTPPPGFEAAQDPDPVTGHWPGWIPVGDGAEDRWHREGFQNTPQPVADGTYELCGPKVQGNPERFEKHVLIPHGAFSLPETGRTFESIKALLETLTVEGIVWHHPDGRMVKIKRKDFFKSSSRGFHWQSIRMTLPDKRYTIIYADPPWMYGGQLWNRGGTDRHYNTQDCDWIARLPVGQIADWNSVCFMWATMPRLPEALYVMRAWGFEYKTVAFTWVKMNQNTGRPYFGMGSYTRANAELCLLGTRGNLPERQDKGVSQLIVCNVSDHSRKPDEARDRIVRLYGDLPRVELFARGDKDALIDRHDGWDTWGNESLQVETEVA